MLLKKFFVVAGKGESSTSPLNAFDKALSEAGIDHCNLVPVSSILPEGAKPVGYKKIKPGSITFCVLARKDGVKGESISAGLGWATCEGVGQKYGIVAEDEGRTSGRQTQKNLDDKVREMACARKIRIINTQTKILSLNRINQKYGSVIVALVYTK